MTEKNPQSAVQREARQVKGPYGGRRPYHSRAARDDRAGPSRYRGHKRRPPGRKQGGTVEYVFRISPLMICQGWDFFIPAP